MEKSKQSKKSGQNFNWSFVIVCFLLSGAVLLNMVSNRGREIMNKNIIALQNKEENGALIKDNKYQYNSIELSYTLKDGNNVVYITKNGVKKVLLDKVIYDAPGGSEPKFYKTDKANIALLESGLGDMGSIIKEYYYIDLLSERILSVVNNSASMSVNGVKLSFGINDNCGTGADRVAGKAYLNNLLVDDSVKYTFNPAIQLICVNPDGFGPIYESEPAFNFTSADLDLGKVYFSVSQSSFIFNISDRSITKDSSWSLYTNTKYGFEFQYPKDLVLKEVDTQMGDNIGIKLSFDYNKDTQTMSFNIFPAPNYKDSMAAFMGVNNFADNVVKVLERKNDITNINGFPTLNYCGVPGYIDYCSTFIIHNNNLFMFDYRDSIPNYYREILSTVKFLDSQDLKNNWQTYTNTKYGFEFQYPKDWEVKQENDGSIYLTSNLPWPQEGKAFVIRETEKSLAKFIDDYNKSDMMADGTALSTIFEQKDYSIAGVRADLLKGSTAIGVTSNMIFITHNNRNYVIDFNDQSNNHLQILKSFKFIK